MYNKNINLGMEGDERFTKCRLCLSGTVDLIHVFEKKGNPVYVPAEVITELLRQEVSSEDSYPQCVCACCMKKLEDFKHFKDQCEECWRMLEHVHATAKVSSNKIIPREVKMCTEEVLAGCPDAVNEGISSSLPLKEPQTVEIFTAKQEEAEYSQEGVRDPLASDKSDDENLCSVGGQKTDLDGSDSDFKEKEYTEDGASRNGSKDPLACGDYEEDDLMFASTLRGDHEKPALGPNEKEYAVDEESLDLKESQQSSGSVEKEMEPISKIFKCPECSKEYSCPIKYSRHLQEHGLGRDLKRKVLVPSKSSLAKRTTSHSVSKLSCRICGKRFKDKSGLNLHMVLHGDKEFKCSECGKDFFMLSDLKEHESLHLNKTAHECNICDRTFVHKQSLKKHMVLHSKKKVECGHCQKIFFTVQELELHKYSHSEEKTHECDLCGKRFHSEALVVKHKRTHEKVPKKKHSCSECDRAFLSGSSLRVHMRTHTGEKPFSCMFCDKRFSAKNNLTVHVRTQHSEWRPTPMQCDKCSHWYSSLRSLQYHKRTMHA